MCNPIHADVLVLMKSRSDGNWWLISNEGARKLDEDSVVRMMDGCFSTSSVTYCPHEGKLLVWSRSGRAAIGLVGADPDDPDVWCNIAKLGELLKGKLPEEISSEDVYAAASDLFWGSPRTTEVVLT